MKFIGHQPAILFSKKTSAASLHLNNQAVMTCSKSVLTKINLQRQHVCTILIN
jgi:hypothetical protein